MGEREPDSRLRGARLDHRVHGLARVAHALEPALPVRGGLPGPQATDIKLSIPVVKAAADDAGIELERKPDHAALHLALHLVYQDLE